MICTRLCLSTWIWMPEVEDRVRFILATGTYADGVTRRPLAGAESVADVEAFPWPDPDDLDYGRVALEARRLSAPYAVKGGWAPIFCQVTNLFGMEDGLVALLTRPLVIEATVAHILDFYLDVLQRVHDACEGHLDFAPLGDDFADQRRLLVSPELWRRIFWTGLYQAV